MIKKILPVDRTARFRDAGMERQRPNLPPDRRLLRRNEPETGIVSELHPHDERTQGSRFRLRRHAARPNAVLPRR